MWSSGCSVYVRVCLHSCACFAPQRTGASRSSVQWLTVLLSIADEGAVTLLCQYKQTRISLSVSEAHTHTHAQRASATTINPCRAISHPVLDIAMYSKPSSNKTVREIQSFSWQCICLCHIYYLSSVVFYMYFLVSHLGFEGISLDIRVQKLLHPINIWGFVNTPMRSCLASPSPPNLHTHLHQLTSHLCLARLFRATS